MEIALFGGSFNPPHLGHAAVLEHLGILQNPDGTQRFEQIWLVPTHVHPFGKPLLAFPQRIKLCQIFLEDLAKNPPRFKVMDIEKDIPGENRTVDTLRSLKTNFPDDSFTLVLGSDLKKDLPQWKEAPTLAQLAKIYFIPRKGFYEEGTSKSAKPFAPEISSSEIRKKINEKKEFQTLVTQGVADFIVKESFYR